MSSIVMSGSTDASAPLNGCASNSVRRTNSLEISHEAIDGARRYWAQSADGQVFWATSNTIETCPAGLYKCIHVEGIGPALARIIVQTDDIIEVGNTINTAVVTGIKHFWSSDVEQEYRRRGFLYKRGILLYGDPATGKTSIVHTIIREIIQQNGLALYAERPSLLTDALQMIRRNEPNRPIVVVLEDFEILIKDRESEWLSVLDGEVQIDNIVFIATTNYPDLLDKRLTDRPSRFDMLVHVPMPSALTRAAYLRRKEPTMDVAEIRKWIERTTNFSIAHLKELIISVRVLGNNFEQTLRRLEQMKQRKLSTETIERDARGADGFGFTTTKQVPDDRERIDWVTFEKEYFHGN